MNTLVDQRNTAAFGVIELHAVLRRRTGSRLSADSCHPLDLRWNRGFLLGGFGCRLDTQ
jgi:hypothetical protein